MHTKRGLVLLIMIITFVITACGTAQPEKQAQAVAKDYLSKLYTISDYSAFPGSVEQTTIIQDTYKPFFTVQGFKSFIANRIPTIPQQAAAQGRFNLQLEDVTFKTSTTKEDQVIFDYELALKVTYPADNSIKEIQQTGQLTLLNENGNWKIANDHPDINELFVKT